ncbi:hypothetical protein ACOMHN_045646 [Nucella lapillus]
MIGTIRPKKGNRSKAEGKQRRRQCLPRCVWIMTSNVPGPQATRTTSRIFQNNCQHLPEQLPESSRTTASIFQNLPEQLPASSRTNCQHLPEPTARIFQNQLPESSRITARIFQNNCQNLPE